MTQEPKEHYKLLGSYRSTDFVGTEFEAELKTIARLIPTEVERIAGILLHSHLDQGKIPDYSPHTVVFAELVGVLSFTVMAVLAPIADGDRIQILAEYLSALAAAAIRANAKAVIDNQSIIAKVRNEKFGLGSAVN